MRSAVGGDAGVASILSANKSPPLENRVYCGQKVVSDLGFDNVAGCSQAQSFLNDIGRRFLADEEDLGVGDKFADLSSGLDAIHLGESNVEENQVWFQFGGLLNPVASVECFGDDLQLGFVRQDGASQFQKGCEVFDQENANRSNFHAFGAQVNRFS